MITDQQIRSVLEGLDLLEQILKDEIVSLRKNIKKQKQRTMGDKRDIMFKTFRALKSCRMVMARRDALEFSLDCFADEYDSELSKIEEFPHSPNEWLHPDRVRPSP